MNHALDAMGNRGGIGGEEAGVEAADAAGRGDRPRNQEQARRIGQQACIRERRPGAFQLDRLVYLAAEAEAGFLAGFADRCYRKRTRARSYDFGAALEQISFEFLGDRGGNGHAVVSLVEAAAGKHELARHEHHIVMALADQHLWLLAGTIDQDQRRRILRPKVGMMIGFFFFLGRGSSFGHSIPDFSSSCCFWFS